MGKTYWLMPRKNWKSCDFLKISEISCHRTPLTTHFSFLGIVFLWHLSGPKYIFENNHFVVFWKSLNNRHENQKNTKNKKLCHCDIALEINLDYFEFIKILTETSLVRSRYNVQKIRKSHMLSKRFRVVPISPFMIKTLRPMPLSLSRK